MKADFLYGSRNAPCDGRYAYRAACPVPKLAPPLFVGGHPRGGARLRMTLGEGAPDVESSRHPFSSTAASGQWSALTTRAKAIRLRARRQVGLANGYNTRRRALETGAPLAGYPRESVFLPGWGDPAEAKMAGIEGVSL